MGDRPHPSPLAREVTDLYLGIMSALRGGSAPATQSALAIAIVMTGEQRGLTGQILLDWIAAISLAAQSAVLKPPNDSK